MVQLYLYEVLIAKNLRYCCGKSTSLPAVSPVVNCQATDLISDDSGGGSQVAGRRGKVAAGTLKGIDDYIALKQTGPVFE